MYKSINRDVGDKMIKLIIFDQDGTLYKRDNQLMLTTRKLTKEWLMKSLNIDYVEVENLYRELPQNFPNPYYGFKSLGLRVEDYMAEVFDRVNPADFIEFNNKLYDFFKNSKLKKALVTFASPKYTVKLQNKLNIYDYYSKIIYGKELKTYSKHEAYQKLIDLFEVDLNEVCVVGDDYENDIRPAHEIGCKSIWVTEECNRENEFHVESIEDFLKLSLEKI